MYLFTKIQVFTPLHTLAICSIVSKLTSKEFEAALTTFSIMKMDFDFEACAAWIREKAAALALAGIKVKKVETHANEFTEKGIVVKASGSFAEGDLVVWEHGRTNMMVFSLSENEMVLERDTDISASNYIENIEPFFRLFERN